MHHAMRQLCALRAWGEAGVAAIARQYAAQLPVPSLISPRQATAEFERTHGVFPLRSVAHKDCNTHRAQALRRSCVRSCVRSTPVPARRALVKFPGTHRAVHLAPASVPSCASTSLIGAASAAWTSRGARSSRHRLALCVCRRTHTTPAPDRHQDCFIIATAPARHSHLRRSPSRACCSAGEHLRPKG